MANNIQVNRRLLLSILRAPSVHSPLRSPLCHQILAIRSISTSSPNYAPPSVSFGEETDQLIAALEPQKSRSKKRSPLAQQKSAERSGKGQQRKTILAKLEQLDGTQQQKKSEVREGDKEVETSRVEALKGKDEVTRRKRKIRTASSEKKGQRTLIKAKDTATINGSQENDIYDEPVLLEVPEPVSDSYPVPKATHSTRSTHAGLKSPSNPVQRSATVKSAALISSSSTEPKSQISALRSPGSEPWQIQKHALKMKFTEGWQPRKKLSPDTLMGIRSLHERDPEKFSTENLSRQFAVSPEAIRRILRTKWGMTPEQLEERRQRWAKRHDRIWDHKAELGQRPARTREKKVDGPEKFEEFIMQKQALGEI